MKQGRLFILYIIYFQCLSSRDILLALRDTLLQGWAKEITDLTKITGSMYLTMMQMRRYDAIHCLIITFKVVCVQEPVS